jgi:hypothetical protein
MTMGQRRFGPTLGAGVAVVEKGGDRLIQPAALGVAWFLGKLRKGDPGKLLQCGSLADQLKKVGDYVDSSEVPEAGFDFWNLGEGKGRLFFQRLTDGTEVKALTTSYSRHTGHGFKYGTLSDPTYSQTKRALLKVEAHNGGRWAGRLKVLTGSVAVVGTDITATTITTGITMLKNEWAGGVARLKGVTSKTYPVVSNSTAGVVTVKGDSTMAADLAAGSDPTQADWELVLDTEVQAFPTAKAGTRRALAILWKDGEEDETNLFGLEVYEDETKVLDYPNLSMDPASKWYAPKLINEDTSNFWITVTDLLGSVTYTSDLRPANFYGAILDWSADTMTGEVCHVRSVTSVNADAGFVGQFTMPSPNRLKRQRLTITFTGATTFGVTSDATEGAKHAALPSGTVGTAYASDNRHVPGFTVLAGHGAWSSGDTIVIDVIPFPVDEDGNGLLAGWSLYPDQTGNKRTKFRIKSNTANTITLETTPTPTPDEAQRATGLNTGTLVFPLTLSDTSLTLITSRYGKKVLTIAAGAHASNTVLAAAINTAWQSTTGSAGTIAAAASSPSNSVTLSPDSTTDLEVGIESFLVVDSTDANADLSLGASEYTIGVIGDVYRVEAPVELRGGYDGDEPGQAQYLSALSFSTSLAGQFKGQNVGLVKIATPGYTDTTVQKAGLALAEAYAYEYRVEIPSNTTDDAAAVAEINDTIGKSDMGCTFFPSYAYVPSQKGNGIVLQSLTGALLGREALVADQFGGYHKVPAGLGVTLPHIVRLPTDDRVLDEELLNPNGINVVKKIDGNFTMWGGRTIALDPTWKFVQHRRLISHYERILLEQMQFLVFAINDPETDADAYTTLYAFFLQEWQKRALRGDKPQDAFRIKIDATNNTNLTRALGDMNAAITVRPADTVERFVITLGKAGIFEDLAA